MTTEMTPSSSKVEATIEISHIIYSGGAFAYCQNGDQVFLNARIVDKMKLKEGDVCNALLIKNFDDKKDSSQWRAVRVSTAA